MKPNLRATETGSTMTGLLRLERRLRRAELEPVARAERVRAAAHRPPVDARAVRRAEVGDRPAVRTWPDLGVAARDVGVVDHDVAVARAPQRRALRTHHVALAVEDDDPAAHARDARLGQLLGHAVRRRVDHRVAVVGLLHLAAGGGAHGTGLDAELPERELLVGAELDLRPADQREALAPRVLEQVRAQLVEHLMLDVCVALAVLRAEVDEVLVGDVRAAQRHRAVVVHLLGELARELDGPHLGAEDAAEGALDEIGEFAFKIAEDAHRCTGRTRSERFCRPQGSGRAPNSGRGHARTSDRPRPPVPRAPAPRPARRPRWRRARSPGRPPPAGPRPAPPPTPWRP